jgi:hypothetical protein
MRRKLSMAALVTAAAMLLVAPTAGANVKLDGGATSLKLNPATAQALTANGVSVTPLDPARVRRGAVAFPITGGSIDPANARGRIDHSGGLALRAGGTGVALRSFRVHVGARRAILTARVGGGRLTVLSLSLRRAKVGRDGLGTVVRGVRAVLSGQAARALNAAFDTNLFAKGLAIGKVTVRAVPSQVELAGGATTLALDQGAAQALQSLNIQAAPIDPATAGGGGLSFPITGGKANAETFAGSIRHSGGIRLSRGDTVVDLTAFTIKVDSSPDLTARVGDARVSILDLDLSQLEASVRGRGIELSGVRATLTAAAAQALNQAFSTGAFEEGLLVGTATVSARAG